MGQRASGRRRVLLCGYYGEHNLGDDALLDVLLRQLPDDCQLSITAHDPTPVLQRAPSARLVPRRSLLAAVRALKQTDVLVFGGGSLLQDSTSFKSLLYYLTLLLIARARGLTVVLWGQGLGPLRRRRSRWLVRRCLACASRISWRDPASLALAQRWRIPVPMAMGPDPVWCHPGSPRHGDGPIVLCWRPTPLLDPQGWRRLGQALDQLMASQPDVSLLWLAFHAEQDGPLLSWLSDQGLLPARLQAISTTAVARSLPDVLDRFARSRLVIPMRLHALVLAQLAGAPCAALSYDPKVAAAAAMAAVPCHELADLPAAEVIAACWQQQIGQVPNPERLARIRQDAGVHQATLNAVWSADGSGPCVANS